AGVPAVGDVSVPQVRPAQQGSAGDCRAGPALPPVAGRWRRLGAAGPSGTVCGDGGESDPGRAGRDRASTSSQVAGGPGGGQAGGRLFYRRRRPGTPSPRRGTAQGPGNGPLPGGNTALCERGLRLTMQGRTKPIPWRFGSTALSWIRLNPRRQPSVSVPALSGCS